LSGEVLVDTGPIVAVLSESDQYHQRCVDQLRVIPARLITCWPVITESAWLLRAYPAAIERLLSSFGGRPFHLAALNGTDLPGIAAILVKYKNLNIQLADASLLHLANREQIDTIFTLDRRDFSVLRRAGGRKLRLIP
jgi:predicted nucleic acid-binding protein